MSHSVEWYPRKRIPLRIQLPGYRPITMNAGQDLGYLSVGSDLIQFRYGALLGKEHRRTCHALLIREHGRVGTWTPKEAKKKR